MSQIVAIQGLRGVAVGGVLLFHVASYRWPLGLLGVDMFFLISGFLMCSIMSKSSASVEQFYFRRIRRIVPSYLFLIGLVLFGAAGGFVSAIDYWHLLHETKRGLKFTSNIPNPHENNYFRQGIGLYYFLRHLWSLSTELQFYVLVPLLCFGLSKIRLHFRLFTCLLIGVVSFVSQLLDDGDSAHMALHNRIWQFMCGFVAFYVKSLLRNDDHRHIQIGDVETKAYSLLENPIVTPKQPSCSYLSSWNRMDRFGPIVSIILNNILQLILLKLIFGQTTIDMSMLRLLVLFFSALIIIFPPTQWTILNLPPLVWLGDISYSVYLLHWPPIQWYFYDNGTAVMSEMVMFSTIVFSLTFGALMERFFVYITKITTTWLRLVGVLALCYLFIAAPYSYVHLNEPGIHKQNARTVVRPEDKEQLLYDIDRVWRGEYPNFSNRDLAVFNYQMAAVTHTMATCSNKNSSQIPTRYDIAKEITFGANEPVSDTHGITEYCYEIGNGTKNILIVGNSHAQMMHFGIKKYFEGIYANLTTLSAAACPLIDWEATVNAQHELHRQTCISFRDKIMEAIRAWDHPIDIIVVAHAYQVPYGQPNGTILPVAEDQLPSDKHFHRFQKLYNEFSELAREAVFIPHHQYTIYISAPLELLARKVIANSSLEVFRQIRYVREITPTFSFQQQNQKAPLDDRLKHIKCPKCIHMNWEDVWCNNDFNTCDTIDFDRRIGYFMDQNHVNALGSLMYGRYVRNLYDKEITNT